MFALCGYSLVRALLAWPFLLHYGVNPAVFLVLDVGTAYPLGLGQIRIVTGFRDRDYAAVQFWSLACAVSFLTPYLYLFLAGHAAMPGYVVACLGALIGVLATASALRVRQQVLELELQS